MSVTMANGAVVTIVNPDVTVHVAPPSNQLTVDNAPHVTIGGSSGSVVIPQPTSASTWTIPNPFARVCAVDVYVAGEQVLADVEVTASWVTVTFATPASGHVILS